jgi:hypothetical protein
MIEDLDRTLEELLKRELPPGIVEQVAITFATPDEQFPPTSVTLPAIDLFLYDVRENRELRNNEWLVTRKSDGTATKQRPPIRVDCSYLITAWPSSNAPNPAHDEHHLLGEVMRVILRHPTIPSEMLQVSLRDQQPDLPTVSIQPGKLQSLAEFWQALGGKPKAALNYTVTMALEPYQPFDVGKVVVDKRLKFAVAEKANRNE